MRTWLILLPALMFAACSGDDEKTTTDTGVTGDDDDDDVGDDDDDDTTDPIQSILGLTGDSGAGMSVYDVNCAACHLADGSGSTGPTLQQAIALEEIVEVVYFGEGIMSAYGQVLTEQEIADVAAYVQTFAP
jgi:cytochrome c553